MSIKEEKIKAVKTWLELKLVRDILIFLGFPNFYLRFIKGYSRIVALLTLMLRITTSAASTSTYLKATYNSSFLIIKAKATLTRLR